MKPRNYIPDSLIEIGFIRRPFGVGGAVILTPSGSVPERFNDLDEVCLVRSGVVLGNYHIQNVKFMRKGIVIRFSEVQSLEEAEKLRNTYICVDEKSAIQLDEWEFFHHQLIGMTVVTSQGNRIGKLVRIMETGANDVYVILDKDETEILIPAIRDVIVSVDPEHGIMTIDPMEGMLPD